MVALRFSALVNVNQVHVYRCVEGFVVFNFAVTFCILAKLEVDQGLLPLAFFWFDKFPAMRKFTENCQNCVG